MSIGVAFALFAGALVLIEVGNVFLGLWSDRLVDYLRRSRQRSAKPKFPWSDRTGT